MRNTSARHDSITAYLINNVTDNIVSQLSHIFNLWLQCGVFPDEMKLANIIPLYQNGNKMIISKYRPVSLLSIFSKKWKKIMYNRIMDFLNNHDVLYKVQFGSSKKTICGVQQRPFLFLLHVNDIVNLYDNIFQILFADDANVFIGGENLFNKTVYMKNKYVSQ